MPHCLGMHHRAGHRDPQQQRARPPPPTRVVTDEGVRVDEEVGRIVVVGVAEFMSNEED